MLSPLLCLPLCWSIRGGSRIQRVARALFTSFCRRPCPYHSLSFPREEHTLDSDIKDALLPILQATHPSSPSFQEICASTRCASGTIRARHHLTLRTFRSIGDYHRGCQVCTLRRAFVVRVLTQLLHASTSMDDTTRARRRTATRRRAGRAERTCTPPR